MAVPPLLPSGTYYGRCTQSITCGSCHVSEFSYPPDAQVPAHSHALPFFSALVRGAYDEADGRRTVACRTGTVLFHPLGQTHADRFHGDGGVCLNVAMDPLWFAAVIGDQTPLAGQALDAAPLAAELRRELLDSHQPSVLVVESLAAAMVGRAVAARSAVDPRRPRWLRRVIDYLDVPGTFDTSIAALSKVADVDPSHLIRTFGRYCGCTPGEFVRRRRIDAARWRLVMTTASITEIAAAEGFADHAHFSRTFRRLTGVTPSEYRRMHARS